MPYELSRDTAVIEALLRAANTGDIVSYSTMSSAIGRDVRASARTSIDSARRRCLRDGIAFGCERTVGMKRLDSLGAIDLGCSRFIHIKRTARRAVREVTAIDNFDALPADIKRKHNAALGTFGVIAYVSATHTIKRLSTSDAGAAQAGLPLAQMLEAIKGAM